MVLTAEQKKIITATVPALELHGEQISARMYQLLFAEEPQAKEYFNMTHQANGSQPRALGNALVQYGKAIDKFGDIESLGSLGQIMVQKHCGLQIKPRHYTWVGKRLLQAMVDVLGADTASPDVLEAWGAAYWALAKVLISAEKKVYDETAVAPGGWEGARQFKVVQKQKETDVLTSFVFEPVDGKPVMDYSAGQFLTFRFDVNGQEIRRNYTLSQAPNGKTYRITVRFEPRGLASSYLHNQVNVDSVVDVYPPAGSFVLANNDLPVVLLSGGIGVTPLLAMAEELAKTDRKVLFIHWTRNARVEPFRDAVEEFGKNNKNFKSKVVYENDALGGRPSLVQLEEWLPGKAEIYCVGPKPFMASIHRSVLKMGIPEENFHYEFFGPTELLK